VPIDRDAAPMTVRMNGDRDQLARVLIIVDHEDVESSHLPDERKRRGFPAVAGRWLCFVHIRGVVQFACRRDVLALCRDRRKK
jgi:hypothetical protein